MVARQARGAQLQAQRLGAPRHAGRQLRATTSAPAARRRRRAPTRRRAAARPRPPPAAAPRGAPPSAPRAAAVAPRAVLHPVQAARGQQVRRARATRGRRPARRCSAWIASARCAALWARLKRPAKCSAIASRKRGLRGALALERAPLLGARGQRDQRVERLDHQHQARSVPTQHRSGTGSATGRSAGCRRRTTPAPSLSPSVSAATVAAANSSTSQMAPRMPVAAQPLSAGSTWRDVIVRPSRPSARPASRRGAAPRRRATARRPAAAARSSR